MHATLRRYEGVDRERTDELTEKVTDSLMPRLSELPGFNGYYLIEAGEGVITSISLFETSAQADESTRVASGTGLRGDLPDDERTGDRTQDGPSGRSRLDPPRQ